MKKLFLLLTATAFGFAAMAGDPMTITTTDDGTTVSLPFNKYANGSDPDHTNTPDVKDDAIAYSWQGGNAAIIKQSVQTYYGTDIAGFTTWQFAKQQVYKLTVKGTCTASGKFKVGIVDQTEAVGWFFKNSSFGDMTVTQDGEETDFIESGKEFEGNVVLTITALGTEEFPDKAKTNTPELVFAYELADTIAATEYNDGENPNYDASNAKDVDFAFSVFKFEYLGDLSIYENPYALNNKGKADNEADGYKYQEQFDLTKTQVAAKPTTSDFFNFNLAGTASQDVSSLIIALWDASSDAEKAYSASLCAEDVAKMTTIKANIEAGKDFTVQGSLPVLRNAQGTEGKYQVVFLAQSQYNGNQIILDFKTAEFTDGEDKGYGVPKVAVEEIAAADAIVNGVIYSEGAIVIYNQAGQKVAAASQEFAIASLGAGVYFAKTAEGSFSFVVK